MSASNIIVPPALSRKLLLTVNNATKSKCLSSKSDISSEKFLLNAKEDLSSQQSCLWRKFNSAGFISATQMSKTSCCSLVHFIAQWSWFWVAEWTSPLAKHANLLRPVGESLERVGKVQKPNISKIIGKQRKALFSLLNHLWLKLNFVGIGPLRVWSPKSRVNPLLDSPWPNRGHAWKGVDGSTGTSSVGGRVGRLISKNLQRCFAIGSDPPHTWQKLLAGSYINRKASAVDFPFQFIYDCELFSASLCCILACVAILFSRADKCNIFCLKSLIKLTSTKNCRQAWHPVLGFLWESLIRPRDYCVGEAWIWDTAEACILPTTWIRLWQFLADATPSAGFNWVFVFKSIEVDFLFACEHFQQNNGLTKTLRPMTA